MNHVLPLQFLNLGGEMLYIIDQRLRAQQVPPDRAAKVRNDILAIMLNRRFIEEVFKPQVPYTWSALRSVFERLAHGSIMRLNSASMDKLFDLMIMALKQQVVQCKHPREMLLFTLNHLDSLREYATAAPVASLLDQALVLFLKTYIDMTEGDLAEIRRVLLDFVQDLQTRVSIFLREGIQTAQGKFVLATSGPVPMGTELPGLIRNFDENGEVCNTSYFPNGGDYKQPDTSASYHPTPRPRGTTLGTNLYALRDSVDEEEASKDDGEISEPNYISEEANTVELDLLAQLLKPSLPTQPVFRLNLFKGTDDSADDVDDEAGNKGNVTLLENKGAQNPELQKLLQDLNVEDKNDDKEMDLLDLLDSV